MGGPVYDPSPFLGGNQGPVSGGVAKAGYAAAVLNTLDKGYKEKREREGAQLKSQFDFDNQQVEQAHANQQKYANHPQLAEKYTHDYAAALKERDKTNAKLKKYYGAKDTVWAALWDKARSAKTGSGTGSPAPGAKGSAPAGPPQPQTGVNQGAPGAAGVGKAFKVGDDYTSAQANLDLADAISRGASQEQIAQIDKNTNDAILANQGEAQAQIQRQKALTATVAPIFKNLAAVPANQLSDKLPYAIDTLYESTSDAYPLDNPYFADPKDQAAKAAAQVWKEAAAKAPAEHAISALERLKQRPEMKDQVGWIEGKLAQFHTELQGLSEKATPKPLSLDKDRQAAADRTHGYDFSKSWDDQSLDVRTAATGNLSKLTSNEDTLRSSISTARIDEIKARTKRLNQEIAGGGGAGKGKPETTRSIAERGARIVASVQGSMSSGTDDAGQITPQQKADTNRAIAKSFLDLNPEFSKKMKPGEDPVVFINRMRMAPAETLGASAPPVPKTGASAAPSTLNVPPTQLGGAVDQIAP